FMPWLVGTAYLHSVLVQERYPAALGLTTKDQRDLHVSQLRAADETLRWLSQNEPAIREAMASK
ncbi:MAG: hypothetical protein AAF141_05950, partial [Pseudomonadota bacterium]